MVDCGEQASVRSPTVREGHAQISNYIRDQSDRRIGSATLMRGKSLTCRQALQLKPVYDHVGQRSQTEARLRQVEDLARIREAQPLDQSVIQVITSKPQH